MEQSKNRQNSTTTQLQASATKTNCCDFCGEELRPYSGDFLAEFGFLRPCDCSDSVKRMQLEAEQLEKERVERIQRAADDRAAERLKNSIASSGIPARYLGANLEAFDPADNADALRIATEYIGNFTRQTTTGLFLIGPPGVGKTLLASIVSLELVRKGFTAAFETVPSLLAKIRATYNDNNLDESEILRRYTHCGLLVLDDLGKEKPSEWAEEQIYNIVNTRYAENRPVLVTTNCGIADIQNRYTWSGEAIVSRLHEMCNGVMLKGRDRRRPK